LRLENELLIARKTFNDALEHKKHQDRAKKVEQIEKEELRVKNERMMVKMGLERGKDFGQQRKDNMSSVLYKKKLERESSLDSKK
jgi:hypothetical protein